MRAKVKFRSSEYGLVIREHDLSREMVEKLASGLEVTLTDETEPKVEEIEFPTDPPPPAQRYTGKKK